MCLWWWAAARGLPGLRKEVQTRPQPSISSAHPRDGPWTLQPTVLKTASLGTL